jgi:hypothetical protein
MKSSDVFPGSRRVQQLLLGGAAESSQEAWEKRADTADARLDDAIKRIGFLEQRVQSLSRRQHTPNDPEVEQDYLLFVGTPAGYQLRDVRGRLPQRGESLDEGEVKLEVVRVGWSPLPGDARACVFAF